MLRKGGSLWVVINYYRDNPCSDQWGPLLAVPTHVLSGEEWAQWFRDSAQLAAYRAEGVLHVRGIKC